MQWWWSGGSGSGGAAGAARTPSLRQWRAAVGGSGEEGGVRASVGRVRAESRDNEGARRASAVKAAGIPSRCGGEGALARINCYPLLRQNVTQETHFLQPKSTLAEFGIELVISKPREYNLQVLFVFFFTLGIN